MSKINEHERLIDELMSDIEDIINGDSVATNPCSLDSIHTIQFDDQHKYSSFVDDFLGPFQTNQERRNVASTSSHSPESFDLEEYEHPLSSFAEVIASSPINQSYSHQILSDRLRIVQQPFQSSKLRYRADYNREKRRLGSLTHKTLCTSVKGPAISIPQCYLNSNDDYYIRITLLTTKYDQTSVHYFHPYDLEDAKDKGYIDRANNSVWFPIDLEDSIKNFPFLRIVKKKSFEIQRLRSVRVFDCHPHMFSDSVSNEHFIDKDIDVFKEYKIEKSQLAFTLARKTLVHDEIHMILYTHTTVLSEEMTENEEKQPDDDSSNEQSSPKGRNYILKYAPKNGIIGSNEEMLVYFRKKIDVKKNGNINITFECKTIDNHWTHMVSNFEIEDRMISFPVPTFPYEITDSTTVDIILQQQNCILDKFKYSYLPQK